MKKKMLSIFGTRPEAIKMAPVIKALELHPEEFERKGKKVFFGLGPERFLIALLTRTNLLLPVLRPVWRIFRPIVRRFFLP